METMKRTEEKKELRKRLAHLSNEELLKGGEIIININGTDYLFDFTVSKVK